MQDQQPVEYPVELTCSQDLIWLAQKDYGCTALYNLTFGFRFNGPMDLPAFQRAFDQLVEEAGCLRLTMSEINGRALQSVQPQATLVLQVRDFSVEPQPEAAFEAWVRSQALIAFTDLSNLVAGCTLALLSADRAVWVLTIHHILADSWGLYLLYQRLNRLYEAFKQGEPAPEPRLPAYEELVKADEAYRSSAQFTADQSYWQAKTKLAGSPLQLFGQADRPAPKPSRRIEFDLPPELVKRLADMLSTPEFQARTANVALFNVLFTSYAVLLYRICNQPDFMIGVPHLNRPGILRQTPGVTVEQVPLLVQVEASDTFWTLYQKIQQESKEAAQHSRYPVPDPHNRVYNVVFNLHNRPYDGKQIETWWFSDDDFTDLALNVFNPDLKAGSLRLGFDLANRLFDENQEKRLIACLLRTIEAFLDSPHTSVDFAGFIDPEELRHMLVDFNPCEHHASDERFIQRFAQQVQCHPDQPAVEYKGKALTYGQLDQRAGHIAQHLRRLGFGPGSAVGLYIDRSLDLAAGLLAIFQSGCTYVPLDPSYPTERLRYIETDANLTCILTCRRMQSEFLNGAAVKVWMDELPEAGDQEAPQPALSLPALDLPAYITYTSGSTGRPKGVIVTHRSMIPYLEVESEFLSLGTTDRLLYFAALGFDASVEEIFPALMSGATLVIRPDGLLSLADFNLLLQQKHITVISLPAAFWGEWVCSLEEHREALPPHLRMVLLYAEEPNLQRYLAWKALPGSENVRWINTYGPTEAVVTASNFQPTAQDGDPAEWAHMPIGRPMANHKIYLLNQSLQPVPLGTPGEIYIGGSVSSGYLNLPDENSSAFLADPFADDPGQKMYKTSDRGRFLPDGTLEFLGRVDNQVKLYGYRIEPGEIENRLCACPGVRQSVVLLKKNAACTPILAAYITLFPGANAEPARFQNFLKTYLPNYMLPAEYIILAEFPMTVNGKIDFNALPEPTRQQAEIDFQGAQSALQSQMVVIWEKILGISPIGIDQDFFDLGGTSIVGVRLFDQIKHKLGIWLPVAELFHSPTIRKLSQYIESMPDIYIPSCAVLVRQGCGKPPLFLVHGWGGGVLGYGDLARTLDPDLPIYGLQAAGLLQEQEPDETMQAMVRRYIEAMRLVQPKGPYRLGGYCTGGIIAYAMACELVKQGDTVSLLAMIEGEAPNIQQITPPFFNKKRLRIIIDSLPFWWSDYRKLGLQGIRQRFFSKFRSILRSLNHKQDGKVEYQMSDIVLDDPTPLPDYQMKLLLAQLKAITNYQPEPYSGMVTVYNAYYPTISRALRGPVDDTQGWDQLTGGRVQTRVVKSSHRNIHLPPYCDALAQQLQVDLDRSEESCQG